MSRLEKSGEGENSLWIKSGENVLQSIIRSSIKDTPLIGGQNISNGIFYSGKNAFSKPICSDTLIKLILRLCFLLTVDSKGCRG